MLTGVEGCTPVEYKNSTNESFANLGPSMILMFIYFRYKSIVLKLSITLSVLNTQSQKLVLIVQVAVKTSSLVF